MYFKGERTKEDPLSTEIQRQCQGKKMPSMLPTFSIDLTAKDLYTALAYQKPSSAHIPFHEISLPTQMLYPFLNSNTLLLYFKARNMTMTLRRPIKGTLRQKIRPYDTQSKNVGKKKKKKKEKKTKLFFFCSCASNKLNQSRKGMKIWGTVKEVGRIKREGKLSHPRLRDPGEVHTVRE